MADEVLYDYEKKIMEAGSASRTIRLNPGPGPAGASYDRWEKKARWALGQIVLNPDSNHWTVVAGAIEDGVEEAKIEAVLQAREVPRETDLGPPVERWVKTEWGWWEARVVSMAGEVLECYVQPAKQTMGGYAPPAGALHYSFDGGKTGWRDIGSAYEDYLKASGK